MTVSRSEITLTPAEADLLARIAERIEEDGSCHSGEVSTGRADDLALTVLETLGAVDTDLCGHCDRATEHVITSAGRAYLATHPAARLPEEGEDGADDEPVEDPLWAKIDAAYERYEADRDDRDFGIGGSR